MIDTNILIQAIAKTASALVVIGIAMYAVFGWTRLMLDIAKHSEEMLE